MDNPRLLFKIDPVSGLIWPLLGHFPALDRASKADYIKDANIANYNDYTKEFVRDQFRNGKVKTDAVYTSTKYDYNSKTRCFNFYEIHENIIGSMDIYDGPIFDPNKDYIYNEEDNKETPVTPYTASTFLSQLEHDYKAPTINKDGFFVERKNWNFLVRNILRNINTILIGPTGTGKTELVMKACEVLNIPCHIYDMGSMQDPLTDLLGSHRIMNGDSIFDYAKFVSDIQEPCVILLDELSRAPLTANNILFPCLDSRRTLPIEIADSKNERTIKVHEKVTFIATANIGSEYSGTNEIDAALLNRFLPMQLDYLPEETEIKLIYKRTGVDIETIKKLMKFVTTVRTKYMSGELSKSVSTRETIQCGLLIADGFQLIDAIEFVVANKFINNNYNNEYSDIKKIIMGF